MRTLFFYSLLLLSITSFTQKVSYSHQTFQLRYHDVMQLVANVSSRHHILAFRPKKPTLIYIYDEALQLVGKKEVSITISDKEDIQILSLSNSYLLFAHHKKTKNYQLWKIDGKGEVKDLLPTFNKLIRDQFKDTTAEVQIVVKNNNLYLRTQVYYPDIGKLHISLVKTDYMLNPLASKYIVLPYNKENESLQYVSISGDNHLLLLKRTQNMNGENLLEVLKYNMTTGSVDKAHFGVNSNLFVEPGLLYNSSDSTTIVYSLVRGPINTLSGRVSLMVCKLDKFMQPIKPATLLNYSSHYSFFLLKDVHEKWINFSNNFLSQLPSGNNIASRIINNSFSTNYYYQNQTYPNNYISMPRNQPREYYYGNTNDYIHITRISLMNGEFKVLKNRFLTYRTDQDYKIMEGYGMFEWKNKSYLLLKQALPSKSKGLLLVTGMGNKDIYINELQVYNRYDFLLKQMQYIGNGNIIIPYLNKREVGLMKLKFD